MTISRLSSKDEAVELATQKSQDISSSVQFEFLDGIRGLAALYVVFHHFIGKISFTLPKALSYSLFWLGFGHFAVDIFIVLSGFCLTLPVAGSATLQLRGGVAKYLKRRTRRIVPPYYVALCLSLLSLAVWPQKLTGGDWQSNFGWQNLLAHLTLLHNFSAQRFSLNTAFWSIATEWQIYFFLPFLLLPLWRRFSLSAAVSVALVIGVLPQIIAPHNDTINGACPWYLGLFALGMAGAAFTAKHAQNPETRTKPFLLIALALLLPYIGLKFIQARLEQGLHIEVEWLKDYVGGTIAICSILYCVQTKRAATQRLSRGVSFLESRPVLLLGAFSYSLYLTHGVILNLVELWEVSVHPDPLHSFFFRLFLAVPLAIGFAYGFYLLVERRFITKTIAARQHQEITSSSAVSYPKG